VCLPRSVPLWPEAALGRQKIAAVFEHWAAGWWL
jgi:hypothetical protein